MRIDPGKGYPHPVLRPPEYGDDYPSAEFQVTIECKGNQGSLEVLLTAEFDLSDPDLLRLVGEGSAEYVLVVKSSKTHFRREFRTTEGKIEQLFHGEISGRVEFSPFLICVKPLSVFTARGWHLDFSGLTFNIRPGAVLAEDKPKEYWIDTAEEAAISSIFEDKNNGREDGKWECNMEGDRVQIQLSASDSERFHLARERVNNTADAQYLMNGLYLPVLIYVLNEADKHPQEYNGYRWFTSLNNRLEEVGSALLGEGSSSRAVDAQKVLDYPFVKMPVIAEVER